MKKKRVGEKRKRKIIKNNGKKGVEIGKTEERKTGK